MVKTEWRATRIGVVVALLVAGFSLPADAQYFGRNKVQYDRFDFRVLKTEHFDIHYYPAEADAAKQVARMAERWHARLSTILGHTLTGRQPIILYASHPEFEQTNVIEGMIDEGTGGVTEGAKRRVVLPLAATLAETDHVLGHELVHAFQYDILGLNAEAMPLWFIEGMAEYLSLGPRSPQTAMWLRDSAVQDKLPKIEDLENPRYFPYRYGHAFWAYVSGRWGDQKIGEILQTIGTAQGGPINAPNPITVIETVTETPRDEIASGWHRAIQSYYGVGPGSPDPRVDEREITVINQRTGSGRLNVGPSISPNGQRVAFLSERSRLSIDLYVADTKTGQVIRKLTESAADPHFESLQFLASAGSWDPESRRLAVGTIRSGKPVIAIFDTFNGDIVRQIEFNEIGEIFQPAWSPDGQKIAFSAQVGGYTDLYVHDLGTGQTRRLTNDAYADLQPTWSPDGTRLAFVTDRFSSDLSTLGFNRYDVAIMEVDSDKTAKVDTGMGGNTLNPQWSTDGGSLVFVSDATGRPEIYRLNLAGAQSTRLTNVVTGVSGITPLSPAISVAAQTGRTAAIIFLDGAYEIRFLDALTADAIDVPNTGPADLALLPPSPRSTNEVAESLKDPAVGLPAADTITDTEYDPGLQLIDVGQQIGVAGSSAFGTYISGGISFFFSDVLGNHLLSASTNVNGEVRDIAAQVAYLNRTHRWNWGVFTERVPYVSGSVNSGFVNTGGGPVFVEQQDLLRETHYQMGGLLGYPLSRVTRVEFSAALRHISFDRELHERIFDPNSGNLISDERTDLDSPESLNMAELSAALVRDTAAFGAVSPVLGQRMRIEVTPSAGDLRMTTLTADFRQYVMPFRPVTFAGRFLHAARYGESSEDDRLAPLSIGYPTLVRGYDVYSFDGSDCSPTLTGECPEFDRLFGSRIIVTNLEARLPAFGLANGQLEYGPLPIELFGFYDGGIAWTQSETPTFANGSRQWVSSVGLGARVNLMGIAVGEFNLARPLDTRSRGWQFVFNLRPGF